MKQIEFRCLKQLLLVHERDATVRDDYVAVWMDRRVMDELICWQSIREEGGTAEPLSALVAELLEGVGHKP